MENSTYLKIFEKEKKELENEMYDFSYLSVYFYRKAGSKQIPCGVLKEGVWKFAFSMGGFQPNFEIRARSIPYQKYYKYEFPLKVIYYVKELSGEYENKLEFLIHENENVANLSGALSGADLINVNLSGVNSILADLKGAN